MKAAIYATKKVTDGLQDQMALAFALVDERGWEMTRLVHQDEMLDEAKLKEFLAAVEVGEFGAIALPSLDVFPFQVQDALTALGIELAVYDPAAVERSRVANEVLDRQQKQKAERAGAAAAQIEANKPNYEKLAEADPWKAALMNAFMKKED